MDEEPAPSIAEGNQSLPLALAAALGPAVRLGAPVERVAWSDDGVRVATGADELDADACVVAVPAAVMRRVGFEPALPAKLAGALAGVRYGEAAKLFVPLRRPAAPSAVMSVPERYWSWTATGAGDRPQPVVSCFAGSPGALAGLDVAAGPERWLASLARLRPDLELDPDARPALDLVRRSVGRRRVLHLPAARAGRGGGAAGRAAGLRRRAPGRRVRGADGGRDPQRPRRGPLPARGAGVMADSGRRA